MCVGVVELQMHPMSHFWRGQGRFNIMCLRFVELQMHPYRILEGSGSVLPCVFEVCWIPGAHLLHVEGVRVDVA